MNRFAAALALLDALALEGAQVVAAPDGHLDLVGELGEALSDRLARLCAAPEPDLPTDALAERLARATDGAQRAEACDARPLPELLGAARDAGADYRALRAIAHAHSRAAREVLTLPVEHAIGLPIPFTLVFRRGARTAVATTSREIYATAQAAGHAAFVLRELQAAALAAEQGRARGATLDRWLDLKARSDFRLTPEVAGALEHLARDGDAAGLCFGELLDAFGAELVSVDVHDLAETQKGAA